MIEEDRRVVFRSALAHLDAYRAQWLTDHLRFVALMDKALTSTGDDVIGLTDAEREWAVEHVTKGETLMNLYDEFRRVVSGD